MFFLSFDFKDYQPLFNQPAAAIYSLIVISVFGIEIIAYIIRFFRNDLTLWLELVKNGINLLILWFIYNYPIENALAISIDFKLNVLFLLFTWGLALIIALDSLHVIFKIYRQKRAHLKQQETV